MDKEIKTFRGFPLDEKGCIQGAYPSFSSIIESQVKKITELENEYVMKTFRNLHINPDVLMKQKAEIDRLSQELETYQILAHKRGECYLSSLREIKKQKEEKEQLKQKLDWFLTETVAGKEYRPKEELEELQQENEQLKQQLENEKQLNAEIKKHLVENQTLLKQKYEENKQLAKRICELQSDLSSARCKLYDKLTRFGAMAILRMFSKKKKPILDIGTKIKFSEL